MQFAALQLLALVLVVAGMLAIGCGTTRTTDTSRTATEQLLVSDAIDRTVQQINFHPLAGQKVYLDTKYLSTAVDKEYLISTMRQHLLANGCILADEREEAVYILEARSGSLGTNRSEVLFGVPAMNLPMAIPGVPTTIPEIPVVKKTTHRAVAKIGVFAYHRETGTIVWQSGLREDESTGKDTWVLGAGPFQRGTIHEGTAFAGGEIPNPLKLGRNDRIDQIPVVRIGKEHHFVQRSTEIRRLPETKPSADEQVAAAAAEGEGAKEKQ